MEILYYTNNSKVLKTILLIIFTFLNWLRNYRIFICRGSLSEQKCKRNNDEYILNIITKYIALSF
jgi:hypothetical protein